VLQVVAEIAKVVLNSITYSKLMLVKKQRAKVILLPKVILLLYWNTNWAALIKLVNVIGFFENQL